jgi:hypothetical protein
MIALLEVEKETGIKSERFGVPARTWEEMLHTSRKALLDLLAKYPG